MTALEDDTFRSHTERYRSSGGSSAKYDLSLLVLCTTSLLATSSNDTVLSR